MGVVEQKALRSLALGHLRNQTQTIKIINKMTIVNLLTNKSLSAIFFTKVTV